MQYSQLITDNRNTFIKEFGIQNSSEYAPRYISSEFDSSKGQNYLFMFDHMEYFLDKDNNYIMVTSPYKGYHDNLINLGWDPYKSLYSEGTFSYIKKRERIIRVKGEKIIEKSPDRILELCSFKRIESEYYSYDCLIEFITNCIQENYNKKLIIANLSNLYVLTAHIHSQNFLKQNEKKWKDFLDTNTMEILNKNREYIIGYMLVTIKRENYHLVSFFESKINDDTYFNLMIRKYRNNNSNIKIVPEVIRKENMYYWKNYLCIETREDALNIIESLDDTVFWDELLEIL